MNLLSLPDSTLYKCVPTWSMWCLLCSVMDSCVVAELGMVRLGMCEFLLGMLVTAACWACVAARLKYLQHLMALQTCTSSKLLINHLSFFNNIQSTQLTRCLVQCLRRDLLVHYSVTCDGTTPIPRCLVQCLEKDLPVHYFVIGRGSATVDLERNAGVQPIPVLSSLVKCLVRGLLELGLCPIVLLMCQGLLQCIDCNIPPWLANLAMLSCVGVPGLSAGGLLVLMPCLSSLLLLLAVWAVWQWIMLSFVTRKMVELVGKMVEFVEF